MTSENPDLLVHDVIGRLFEEPEPLHRADLADGAIARGMAVTRRRGFAVAGATLSVLAVVAGAVAVAGGGGGTGNDWSLPADAQQLSPRAFEDPAPSYSDRQREIIAQLPGVLGPLLPAGMTVRQDPGRGIGGFSGLTGDFWPEVTLHSGGGDFYMAVQPDGAGFADAFGKAPATPVSVAGGSIRTTVVPEPDPGNQAAGFNAFYEFAPSAAGAPKIDFNVYGKGTTPPIDAAAFKKMVEAPGFAQLRHLLDPSVPASADAVKHRYALEAQINAEAAKVLPPGLRLKLNPAAPGMLELVGPAGVDTFDWFALTSGAEPKSLCEVGALCHAADSNAPYTRLGPDGVARFGVYKAGSAKPSDPEIVLYIYGRPRTGNPTKLDWTVLGKDGSETAPEGPGLTPQQARAIMTAPGVAKVITDVQKLVAQG